MATACWAGSQIASLHAAVALVRCDSFSPSPQRTVPELNEGIAKFYDSSSGVWEDMWGEHMHHGYYEPDAGTTDVDHRLAQIKMIENTLQYANVPESDKEKPRTVVDVGCGIGGSARYLARKYKAKVNAITLSPVQAQRATDITVSQGLEDLVTFQVADALHQPFASGAFDLVWSMESGEHMPDKKKFVSELARVAAPGGRIIIVTWCHRDLQLGETSLKPEEQELLDKICDVYYLPAWCSPSDYVKLAKGLSLEDIRCDDWSEYVTLFWPSCGAICLELERLGRPCKVRVDNTTWSFCNGSHGAGLPDGAYQSLPSSPAANLYELPVDFLSQQS